MLFLPLGIIVPLMLFPGILMLVRWALLSPPLVRMVRVVRVPLFRRIVMTFLLFCDRVR